MTSLDDTQTLTCRVVTSLAVLIKLPAPMEQYYVLRVCDSVHKLLPKPGSTAKASFIWNIPKSDSVTLGSLVSNTVLKYGVSYKCWLNAPYLVTMYMHACIRTSP